LLQRNQRGKVRRVHAGGGKESKGYGRENRKKKMGRGRGVRWVRGGVGKFGEGRGGEERGAGTWEVGRWG